MFEKRPIWGLILGLNVLILIWLISVQEPVMFDASTAAISSSVINSGTGGGGQGETSAASDDWNRDLLSKHLPLQSSIHVVKIPGAISTLATLNLNNKNNNSKSNNLTQETTKDIFYYEVKTTTKASGLSANMQSLTSSLGTGVLNFKTKPTPSWSTLSAVSSALPDEDYNQLIDLYNFQFLMPQPVCSSHIEALILIHSAPKNHEKRQVIRETWASISHHTSESPLRILFLLGAVNIQQLQEDLQSENNLYRDLIQGSFIDDYRNMTYKHIMAFKWFLYNCPQAQILIKLDDDVYLNTPQLIKYLKQQQQQNDLKFTKIEPTISAILTSNKTLNANTSHTIKTSRKPTLSSTSATLSVFKASQELFNHPKNLLFCQKIIGALVKRSYRSKWRVSFKEYSEHYYPPYCPGYTIIYSPDIIFRLYRAAQSSKYFWIDDVHITGVLAKQTNTTITTSTHYVLSSDECDKILTGKTDLSKTEFLYAWHSISMQKMKLLWHLQMMSIHTPNELHYNKVNINDAYDTQRQDMPGNVVDQYFIDNRKSLSHSHTSSNGFR